MSTNEYFDNADQTALTKYTTARSAVVDAKFDAVTTGLNKLPTEAQFKRGTLTYAGSSTGSLNAYIVTLPYTPSGYVDGLTIDFKANHTNTGAATVNVSGLGVKSLRRNDATAHQANDIITSTIYRYRYNTTTGYFEMQNVAGADASAAAAAVSATAAATSATAAAASAVTAAAEIDVYAGPRMTASTVDTLGVKEVSQVTAVADVSGSLGGKYFQIYARALSGGNIDYTAAEEKIDVWFNVDAGSVAPSGTGAARQIEVSISADDTAATVAAAIVTALAADVSFSAGLNSTAVRITCTTAGARTDISAGDSGMTVSKITDGLYESTGNYWGGVLAQNGKIYCIPDVGTTAVGIIDPVANTFDNTTITGLSGGWVGGVLAPNGKIYCAPLSATTVLIIDPATDTAEETSITGLGGGWMGAVLARNGKIYCVPYSAATVLIIDPTTDTAEETSITGLGAGAKWIGGALGLNGKIYCCPYSATTVLIIDPKTDTAEQTSITGLTGTQKWAACALAGNGKIYCAPSSKTTALIIDPSDDTAEQTSITGITADDTEWSGIVLGANGKLYCVPDYSPNVLVIDPSDDSFEQAAMAGIAGSQKWKGGVLASDGIIYCMTRSAKNVFKIATGLSDVTSMMLSPYYNKL